MEMYVEDVPMPDIGPDSVLNTPIRPKYEILKSKKKTQNENDPEPMDISMSPDEKNLKKSTVRRKLRKSKPNSSSNQVSSRTRALTKRSNSSNAIIKANNQDSVYVSDWTNVHRDIPIVVSGYLQLMFNACVASIFLYFLFKIVFGIQNDVRNRVEYHKILQEEQAADCQREYLSINCDSPGPAIFEVCQKLKQCKMESSNNVGSTKLAALVFAEIIDAFISHISYKTMVFSLILVFGSLLTSNYAFGLYRARHSQNIHDYAANAIPAMIPSSRFLPSNLSDISNRNLIEAASQEEEI
ncbi:Nucleus export protein brr6 [Schizosaccharomyces pombe]|uniref:Nucleus export protein brr6 n=1 Tax=Schizosaccharomyces pombe (strain 972 / ATCC 24843) TaxID=284812 RepID=BRR6_SCHPO|nr:nuclear envelope protein Brr6/Brl1 [Schizosaccharomyces pombe]Q9UT30.1 RecName: Full=Nucleus export protein brr6 [Schizosaccharomyces pombe 972h-]CAB52167.1 nuclear envelope protein Brr6/Brl1 [Schizosaccharomyces pombe]|eukprot:NP_593955.1 nuclear envelope protein Brr6/Brl1 [Schizosaccharomyces pombe]